MEEYVGLLVFEPFAAWSINPELDRPVTETLVLMSGGFEAG